MHWLDPDYLPKLSGTFECFLLNPHGDADPEKDRESKKKEGKHAPALKHHPMHAEGIVRCVLHGPKGETRAMEMVVR